MVACRIHKPRSRRQRRLFAHVDNLSVSNDHRFDRRIGFWSSMNRCTHDGESSYRINTQAFTMNRLASRFRFSLDQLPGDVFVLSVNSVE